MDLIGRLFGPPNIAKLKAKRDTERLAKALTHEGRKIRRDASVALAQLDDPRGLEYLYSFVSDHAYVSWNGGTKRHNRLDESTPEWEAIIGLGNPQTIDFLLQYDPDLDDLTSYIQLLGGRETLRRYIELYHDENEYDLEYWAALATFDPGDVAEELVSDLTGDNQKRRDKRILLLYTGLIYEWLRQGRPSHRLRFFDKGCWWWSPVCRRYDPARANAVIRAVARDERAVALLVPMLDSEYESFRFVVAQLLLWCDITLAQSASESVISALRKPAQPWAVVTQLVQILERVRWKPINEREEALCALALADSQENFAPLAARYGAAAATALLCRSSDVDVAQGSALERTLEGILAAEPANLTESELRLLNDLRLPKDVWDSVVDGSPPLQSTELVACKSIRERARAELQRRGIG